MASKWMLFSGGAAAAALALLEAAQHRLPTSVRARIMLASLAAYLPMYLDGSEYRAAPRRSERASRVLRQLFKMMVDRLFIVKKPIIEAAEELTSCSQCILSVHPHGVLSLDHLLTVIAYDPELERVLPQGRRSALSAGVLFKIPILREVLLWTGCVDAGGRTVDSCLKAGLSLSVVPGGEREQLLAQRGNTETLVLKNRKGFVKYALRHGIPLVPVYCFGENQLYWQSSMFFKVRSWIQRTLGVAVVLPYGGCGGLPGVPVSVPIQLVVGPPLKLPKIDQPSGVEIAEYHAKYMESLEALFKRHRGVAGYPDSELVFI